MAERLAAALDAHGVTARAFVVQEIIQEDDAPVRSDIETVCDDVDVSQITAEGR